MEGTRRRQSGELAKASRSGDGAARCQPSAMVWRGRGLGQRLAVRRRGEEARRRQRVVGGGGRGAAGAKGSGRRAIGRGRAGGGDRAGAPLPRHHACMCVCACVACGGGGVGGRESGWGSWGSGVWARVWWWGGLSRPRLGRLASWATWVGQLGRLAQEGELFSFFICFSFPAAFCLFF